MIFVRLAPVRRGRPACREPPPERLGLWVPLRVEFDIYVRGFRASGDRWPRPRGGRGRTRKPGSGLGPSLTWTNHSRALADARTAEAIVPAIEPDGPIRASPSQSYRCRGIEMSPKRKRTSTTV